MTGRRVRSVVPVRSLRVRVTAVALAVVAVALVVIGVAVEVGLAAQLRRDGEARLDDRLARATLLVSAGTPSAGLPQALDGNGVRAVVLGADGEVIAERRPGAPGAERRGGPGDEGGPRGGPPATSLGRDDDATRVLTLPDGDRLVLVGDPRTDDVVLDRLRVVLIGVGALGLAAIAVALPVGVGAALRPLRSMADLARDIARGDRGRRLRPPRTDTEIGGTAQAFDAMLDALESAQAAAEAAAREARRSEATTRRFLSDAAHELRTPIAGVQTLAETLVRRPDVDLAHRERIATTLVRETRRAGALVADMLELARLDDAAGGEGVRLDRRVMDLVDAAGAAVERASLVDGERDLRLGVEAPAPVVVEADPGRLAQILANLLDNARRHSPPGGRITVEVGRDAAGRASLAVVDEGPGVPDADRERIFDRLVRLDDARTRDAGGAGLGLPIARALARAHGGDLVAESTTAGARLVLTLPARDPRDPRDPGD